MTITSALNNALSGLHATGRATDVIATNISNATTPGYARREVEVSSTSANHIGGVTVNGVVRMNNPAILASRRDAEADFAFASSINTFLTGLETTLGTPDSPNALTNQIADFESQLLLASSRPDAVERLDAAVSSASELASNIQIASKEISQMRSDADSDINSMVDRLNAALVELEELNTQIAEVNIAGLDDSSLLDIRQGVIDEIHEFVPVKLAQRDHGKVALYSNGGVILIDGSARQVEFTDANIVTPYMTLAGGQLSGLSIDGFDVRTDAKSGGFPGGKLAAAFEVRDTLGTDALAQLDAAARNLVERFQDPAVDPTLLPGDAGLFTDAGLAFDPVDEVGLSERLQINAAVDPNQGGETWRLRDGLNATAPGAVGQASLIDALRETLTEQTTPASGDFGTGQLGLSDVVSSMMSRVGVQRLTSEQSLTFAAVTFNEVSQAERAAGVDTDTELQQLIVMEQAYAANARVFDTVQNMLDVLMRLGA